jgi:CMP/dCMP kinase
MYRTLTLFAQRAGILPEHASSLVELAQSLDFDFLPDGRLCVNGEWMGDAIRTPEVSAQVSHYVTLSEVRDALTERMRVFGASHPCILDGRDIGTVVFPNAEYKFFMTADYRVRAERRLAELHAKGLESTLEEVEANLRERDQIDSNRAFAPLRQAADAEIIDTTRLSIEAQVERICTRVSGGAPEQMAATTTP